MPLRDYKCKVCGKVFEVLEKMNATDKVECECGGETEREVSKAYAHFKGPGFFVNDYKQDE